MYQINDRGASIQLIGAFGELFIIKRSITSLQIIRNDLVAINTGSPLRCIFLHFKDVNTPVSRSAIQLRDNIASMLSP